MPLTGRRLAIIGAGNMGEALIRGLLHSNVVPPDKIIVTDRRKPRVDHMHETYAVEATDNNGAALAGADAVVLAVKPQIMGNILRELAPAIEPQTLIISIAAGITCRFLETTIAKHGGPQNRIIRVMPNTPALVGAGATAIARGAHATDDDAAQARAIFEAVGTVSELDESLMDAVTGLSGSGPAYVMMIIEALADAGVKVGLPRYEAQHLAAQTVLGSAKLLIETGQHPGVLKDQVTSPGGTAIAGLATLEAGGLRTTLINGVVAATERSMQLGAMDD